MNYYIVPYGSLNHLKNGVEVVRSLYKLRSFKNIYSFGRTMSKCELKMEEKKKYKNFNFELFGTKWTVKFVDKVDIDGADPNKFYFGHCDTIHNSIQVALKDLKNQPLSEQMIKVSLVHEIVHAIYDTGNYGGSCDDEPLVEWTARCIISLMSQKVFKYAE